jgi:hypothetical protein
MGAKEKPALPFEPSTSITTPVTSVYEKFKARLSNLSKDMANLMVPGFFSLIQSEKQKLLAPTLLSVIMIEEVSMDVINDVKTLSEKGDLQEWRKLMLIYNQDLSGMDKHITNNSNSEHFLDLGRGFAEFGYPDSLTRNTVELSLKGDFRLTFADISSKFFHISNRIKNSFDNIEIGLRKATKMKINSTQENISYGMENEETSNENVAFNFGLTQRQIALFYIYNDCVINSKNHATEIAQAFGFNAENSGKTLYEEYNVVIQKENRTRLINRSANNMIRNIERILPLILYAKNKQTAENEISYLRKSAN